MGIVNFTIPEGLKERLDRKVRKLQVSRSEYLRHLILNDLEKGLEGEGHAKTD